VSKIARVISGAAEASAGAVAPASVVFASSLVLSDGFFLLEYSTLGESTRIAFFGVFLGEFLPLFTGDGEFSLFS
jgi:hypothetical protein